MTETETETKPEFTTITLERDNDRSLRFTGKLLAEVRSEEKSGYWCELKLYVTASDAWVAQEIGRTIWEGRSDRFKASVCKTDAELIEYLGCGWLAQKLYKLVNVDCVETIE